MKILFTGASSFTGYWFVRQLAAQGHEVVAIFRSQESAYSGIRGQRVAMVQDCATCVFECPFGSERFLRLIDEEERWDLLCHHAAEATDYKSLGFNTLEAVQANVKHLPKILEVLHHKGCRRVLLTGSVFEQREGIGSDPERAFSPYGLSKGMTADYFRYYCFIGGMALGKFVIPNPFGPYEEPRLTSYLMHTWAKGGMAEIKTPDYIRDNIHVSLLALAYVDIAEKLQQDVPFTHCSPSQYVESQGAFVERFAAAMRARIGLPCEVVLLPQESFPEPHMRTNCNPVDGALYGWDEQVAWDEIATYYQQVCRL